MNVLLLVKAMPRSQPEISYAGLIARATGASITAMHVATTESERAAGDLLLDEALKHLAGLAVERRLETGDTIRAILNEMETRRYDLVVIGACDETSQAQRRLGPVTRAVFKRSNTSLLVVRQPRVKLGRILICTSGIDTAEDIIRFSAQLAQASHAHATLLHVVGAVPSMYTGLEHIDESLETLLKSQTPIAQHLKRGASILAELEIEAELKLRHGVAADEILREAQLGDYDLVVIGATGSSNRVKEWLLGDVTQRIVMHAACPVLVVK